MSERCLVGVDKYGHGLANFYAFFINIFIGLVLGVIGAIFVAVSGMPTGNLRFLGIVVHCCYLYMFVSVGFAILFKPVRLLFYQFCCPEVFVYYDDNLIASGKANYFFFVPLLKSGDVYTVKFGDNSVNVRLYPENHYVIRKTDFGWKAFKDNSRDNSNVR